MGEIRIYVEGGGDDDYHKSSLRTGFNGFLKSPHTEARSRKIKWNIIPSGSRQATYKNFKRALIDHPDAFNIILVDSERPVNTDPWHHLHQPPDNWENPGVGDNQCHLMVQTMEAWIIADIDTLEKFYGQNFKRNPIPRTPDVETVDKQTLDDALKNATRNTSKGKYHKIRHASKILPTLNEVIVRSKAHHCDRLFKTLDVYIDSA